MTNKFHDLITRMANELDECRRLLLDDCTVTHRLSNEARAALAEEDEPDVPEVVGSEWQPCVKLPITVHVREQRPGEQHVSTREGITPVQPDDLIMLGVDGEEYPIGRELFQRTYRMGSADEPAVPEGREPASVTRQSRPTEDDVEDAAQCIYEAMRFERVETTPAWSELGNSLAQDTARKAARAVLAHWGNPAPAPPADGEVAEAVERLRTVVAAYKSCRNTDHIWSLSGNGVNARLTVTLLTRAAELLERLIPPQPVPVSERLPGHEDMTDDGEVWIEDPGHEYPLADAGDYDWDPHKWILRPIGKFDAQNGLRWLPAHALPLPEVGE